MKSISNVRRTCHPLTAALLLAVAPLTAFAVDAVLPDAGTILQQLAPLTPLTPSSDRGALTIEQPAENKMPASLPFLVHSFEITGNTQIDTPTLLALVAKFQGTTLTLPEVAEVANLITAYYRSHDFPLARAIIPPQTIERGIVRIEVIEALYGQVSLDNSSQVNDALLQSMLSPLQGGQAISQTRMDHVLLLLSDVPGVLVDATLKPGSEIGSSDLVVSTLPGPSVFGSVTLDNYGNRYTGRERLSGALSVLNVLDLGDTLSVNAMSSGRGMHYGRLGYEFMFNGLGTRLGAAYSMLDYVLGAPITTDIHGTAQVTSLWAKHPLIRSRDANVQVQIQYDAIKLRDFYAVTIENDRSLSNLSLSLSGDVRDQWFDSAAVNAWTLNWSTGHVGFDNATAHGADATTANTQGGFSKWNASLVRLQALTPESQLHLTASTQWARNNLDSSQRMSVGGPYSVRAYDPGVMSGDKGYFLGAEYRYTLGQDLAGQWQAVAFVESAHITANAVPWQGVTGANSGRASGVGLGLNWTGPNQWSLKAFLAKPVGAVPSLASSSHSVRAWLELVKKL